MAASDLAVLIPVKDFTRAKLRLAPELDEVARADLARGMATAVVRAARPLPVFVVCDSEPVREWAEHADAAVVWTPGLGLNGAIHAAVDAVAHTGVTRVIVAHSDLPLATDLAWVGATPGVTLVPDRRLDGTNVLAVPTDAGFGFAYGPGSFRAHCDEAKRLGLPLRLVRDERLSWDVDIPDDLALPTHL